MLVDRAPAVANWIRALRRHPGPPDRQGGPRAPDPGRGAQPPSATPSATRRKAAAQGLGHALAEREDTLTLVYNTVAAEKQVEDRWRRFADPAAPRHLANEVDAEAVAALEAAVVAAYPTLSWRYYRLKAKAMGRRALDHWDRNAPLTEAPPRHYAWSEAKALVLEAFRGLSPALRRRRRALLRRARGSTPSRARASSRAPIPTR